MPKQPDEEEVIYEWDSKNDVAPQQHWHCPKHGDQGISFMRFEWRRGGNISKNYCFDCYHELVASHCCELEPVMNRDADNAGAK